jgi:hypothetical protein
MIRNLQKFFTLITLSVLAQLSLFGQTESAIKNVFWQPNELQPGSVIFFTVELNREATKVSGQFLGKDIYRQKKAKENRRQHEGGNGHEEEEKTQRWTLPAQR